LIAGNFVFQLHFSLSLPLQKNEVSVIGTIPLITPGFEARSGLKMKASIKKL
jgi:hypothetical protein